MSYTNMQSQTTLLSSIPERSIRDSYLAALLIVFISIEGLYSIFLFSFSWLFSFHFLLFKAIAACQ